MIHYTLSNNRLLPIEYLEVAYIESTGTLWIDTEYIITKDTYFDIKYMQISSSSSQCVFGYRSVDSPSAVGDMIFFFIRSNGKIGIRYGHEKQDSSNSYSGICNLISDGTSIRLNNELIVQNISYSNSYSPKKAYLFTANLDGYYDADIVKFIGRIYHCIILESGVLKRHFIPCYRKSDNKPGLFDIVEKKFYINQGTGEFLVGDDVRSLPSGYLLLEYIESDGNLYIDTGYIPLGNDIRILTKILYLRYKNNDNYACWFSAYTGESSNSYRIIRNQHANDSIFLYNGSKALNGYTLFSVSVNTIYKIDFNGNLYNINGTIGTLSSTTGDTNTNSITLNKSPHTSTSSTAFNGRFYYFKIYKSNSLVRDLVPSLQTVTGKNGMFDLVNNVFYPSATGVNFISGNPIENIIEVEKTGILNILPDGLELYDYILSSGTLWIDTGYIPNDGSIIEYKALPLKSGSNYCLHVGSIGSSSTNPDLNRNLISGFSGSASFQKGSAYTGTSYTLDGNTHIFYMNTIGTTFIGKVDGSNINVNPNNVSQTLSNQPNPIKIGYSDYSGRITPFKTYYLKLYGSSNLLVRNMLPCTYLGEPGMWDTVEGKFYRNQGTGLFTLGNKIILKLYEYLQGTGTLWINTEWLLTLNFKFNYKVNMQSNGSNPMIWGSYVTGNRYTCQWPYNNQIWNQRYNSGLTLVSAILNLDCIVEDTLNTSIVNGVLNSSNSMTFSNNGVPLGIFNSPGTSYIAKGKLYYFQISDENNLIKDFIPCSYNGEYGLWDRVELKFYGNSGTGTFTVGSEVLQVRNNATITNVGYSYGIEGQYDKDIYTEPDGSKWIRIFHHSNPANARFDSSDTFTTGIYKDENRWFDMAKCNEVNKWELMIKEKSTSDGTLSTYRFIQYVNPMTATFNDVARSKVKYISSGAWGGLYKRNAYAYLVANNGASSNWWGAIGAWNTHEGGSPGWRGAVVTTGYTDVYLRIDNICPIYKGCYLFDETGYCGIPSGVFKCFDNDIFTISFWIKDEDANRSIYLGNYNTTPYFSIEKKADGNLRYFQVRNDGTKDIALFAIPKSKWTLVTLTVNSGTLKAYKNGTLSSTTSIGTKSSSSYANTIFRIGSDTRSDTTRFKGYMLDFRIYDYALTDDEIKNLYNMRNV